MLYILRYFIVQHVIDKIKINMIIQLIIKFVFLSKLSFYLELSSYISHKNIYEKDLSCSLVLQKSKNLNL